MFLEWRNCDLLHQGIIAYRQESTYNQGTSEIMEFWKSEKYLHSDWTENLLKKKKRHANDMTSTIKSCNIH